MESVDEPRLREFCAQLIKAHFNATEAYCQTNPAVTRESAAELGSRLLRKVETQALLSEMVKAAWERNELDPDYIIGCWVAMSRANVMDYFDTDAAGVVTLKNLSQLDVKIQRNISQLEVTTTKAGEMLVEQKIKLKLVDRRQVFDSMAKAAELFGPLGKEGDGQAGVAKAIEDGFERVRKKLGGRTFEAQGIDVTKAIEGQEAL